MNKYNKSDNSTIFFLMDMGYEKKEFAEHSFLSNLFEEKFLYRQRCYDSAEHAFQAAKCLKKSDKKKICNIVSPKSTTIYGRFFEERTDWNAVKIKIMENILRAKFRSRLFSMDDEPLGNLLKKKTGDKQLVAINYWHDRFWGVCVCTKHAYTGQNMIGEIIMKIRAELE